MTTNHIPINQQKCNNNLLVEVATAKLNKVQTNSTEVDLDLHFAEVIYE